jgi:uncharacterized Ntn-hydrolase superfamily protein
MTWSLIARDGHRFGIIVATRFFAVGMLCPHIASRVGAVATQALLNPFYGVEGLAMLREGAAAAHVVARLTAADDGRDQRQLHVMDAAGRSAAHTGKACVDWCGHLVGDGFSVAGNMLVGERVVTDTAAAWESNAALPFPRRLIAAMKAGEAAGGDKRGKQSAALVIHGEEAWPDLELRVDDHADPLAELTRLEQVSRERFVHFARYMARHDNRTGELDRAVIDAGVAAAVAAESTR